MARKIAPMKFECEAAFAPAAYNENGGMVTLKGEAIKRQIEALGYDLQTEFPEAALPISLRWRVAPSLGLPITPFSLFRKQKKSNLPMVPLEMGSIENGLTFQNGPFYRVFITIKNPLTSMANYAIAPLNAEFQDYGGKKQFFNSISPGQSFSFHIDQPYLGGVLINGSSFQIMAATGITMLSYVNDPEWQLIQIVGLPFQEGKIDSNLYSTTKQGYVNALQTPDIACRQRVDIYSLFYKNPPATAPGGAFMPAWKIPNGTQLEKSYQETVPLKNGITGTLNDIREMLTNVYQDAPELYSGFQQNYVKEMQTLGVVDPANPNPKEDGTFQHPVCAATILCASTDNWHALGLGFGTLDFLPLRGLIGERTIAAIVLPGNIHAFDYMISATFRTPVLILVPEQDGFIIKWKLKFKEFEEGEYATLSHFDIQNPLAPSSLLAETTGQNRPLVRDDNYYDHVRLSWHRPSIQDRSPLSYAVAFKDNLSTGGTLKILNEERPFIPGTNQPYVPALRADELAADIPGRAGNGFERFHHSRSAAPFAGSVTQDYYVAAQNIFGLWSKWSPTTHTLAARPPQMPRVISSSLTTKHEGITSHIYPDSKLELMIGWDWEDRTPFEIHLAGYFVSPPNANPPVTVHAITTGNTGGAIERYRIRFNEFVPELFKLDAANNPVAVPPTEGEVIEDTSASAGSSSGSPSASNPDLRTYLVTLRNINLNFSSETKLYFAAYVRGSEAKNPTVFSDFSKPIVVTTADPIPRDPPLFVPDIKFATLPDANNISRYNLRFPPVPGAISYAVYLATEMSLRDRLTSITNYPKDQSIFQRRDALNLASTNPADRKRAIDAFTRINKKPLTLQPGKTLVEIELDLNGDTQGLFIYAVSSFTEQSAESGLSDWIYVAIPERITPGPPVLLGVVNKKLSIPKAVLKVNVGSGNNTSTIELYRTSKEYLGADVNMMGLPVSVGPTIGWNKFKITDGIGDEPVTDSTLPFDYFKVEEEILAGWAPLYYRAVSLGTNQPVNGKLPGRSPASNLLELLPPPPETAPSLTDVTLSADGPAEIRLSFRSNAYVGRSPHGNHTATVFKLNDTTQLFEPFAGGDIPQLRKLGTGEAEPLDKLVRLPGIDPSGVSAYVVNLTVPEQITLKVVVADPFGRKREQSLSFTKPADGGMIIQDIVVKRRLGAVQLSFKTNVSKAQPTVGQNTLIIALRSKNNLVKVLVNVAMHDIPNRPLFIPVRNTSVFGGTQDESGLFVYGAQFRGAININAFNAARAVIVRVTNFKGETVEEQLLLEN